MVRISLLFNYINFHFFPLFFLLLFVVNFKTLKKVSIDNKKDNCEYFLTLVKTKDQGFLHGNYLKQLPTEVKLNFCKST